MRMIRHQATDGSIQLAALQPDGTARGIQGDLFGSLCVTDAVVTSYRSNARADFRAINVTFYQPPRSVMWTNTIRF